MVMLYWDIGRLILERQNHEGWGARIIDRLARDLRKSFPDMKGLSSRNLLFMRGFAAEYSDEAIVKQLASQAGGRTALAVTKHRSTISGRALRSLRSV